MGGQVVVRWACLGGFTLARCEADFGRQQASRRQKVKGQHTGAGAGAQTEDFC